MDAFNQQFYKDGIQVGEIVFYSRHAKLFRLDTTMDPPQWLDRSTGELKLTRKGDTTRLLMWSDPTKIVTCNHFVNSDMDVQTVPGNPTYVMWSTLADFSSQIPKPEIFAAKFHTEGLANEFRILLTNIKDNITNH